MQVSEQSEATQASSARALALINRTRGACTSLTKRAFVVFGSLRHRLKRHSVSRCPRDDLGRLRLPHDVPQALRPERVRTDLPRRRRARPGGFNLQRRDGHLDRRQGLSLAGKVSVLPYFLLSVSVKSLELELLGGCFIARARFRLEKKIERKSLRKM